MTKITLSRRGFVACFFASAASLAAFGFALAPSGGDAHETSKGPLTIEHAWARINIAGRPSAAYAVLHNDGDAADKLVAARSPSFGRVELHTHMMTNGVMRMREVPAIEVPANGKTALEPGGFHLMLFEPTGKLTKGDLFDMVLTFDKAGEVEITVIAENIASGAPKADGHSADGQGGHHHGGHSGAQGAKTD